MAEKFSKVEKFCISIIILCVLVLIYLGTCAILFFRNREIPYVTYTQLDYYNVVDKLYLESYNGNNKALSNSSYKKTLEQELNPQLYIYKEKNAHKQYAGLTLPIIRTIIIDSEIDGYDYCLTLTHEIMHLNHFIANERYICFETFKFLYENEKLHDVGVWYAYKQLTVIYSKDYYIADLVIDYLTKN